MDEARGNANDRSIQHTQGHGGLRCILSERSSPSTLHFLLHKLSRSLSQPKGSQKLYILREKETSAVINSYREWIGDRDGKRVQRKVALMNWICNGIAMSMKDERGKWFKEREKEAEEKRGSYQQFTKLKSRLTKC